MYDDSDLQQSKSYFSIIQVLRIFSKLVSDNVANLKNLAEDCRLVLGNPATQPPHMAHAITTTAQNWTTVVEFHETIANSLLEKIAGLIGDVESLREGVSANFHLQLPYNTQPTIQQELTRRCKPHSCSMLHRCEKPGRAPRSTSTCLSLPL